MRFSDFTTLAVGGEMGHYHLLRSRKKALSEIPLVWESGEDWMVLGGGSNLVVSDKGFPGNVLHVAWKGRRRTSKRDGSVLLTVQAGEDWDELVVHTVSEGLQGLESLSGIPGTVGASVIQNIGAYGCEISQTLDHVEFLDAKTVDITSLSPDELELGHRTSALKTGQLSGVVLSVTFRLTPSDDSLPIAYAQLADALGVAIGDTVSLSRLRETVLSLRQSKGMVVDPDDPDSRSVGSFFVNPVVTERFAHSLPAEAPKWLLDTAADTTVPLDSEPPDATRSDEEDTPVEAMVKLSAAWLIEHSGISKGFQLPGAAAAVSSKHTLAITNPGEATAEDVAALARHIRTHVANTFGVVLQPEPTLVGITLD